MRGRIYWLLRDLHLYLGLFSSPFVLVFAISVFFLVHTWLPRVHGETSNTRTVSAQSLPADLPMLSGRPLIEALKPVLENFEVRGEVGFIKHMLNEEQWIIPVMVPGRETIVTLSLTNRRATIVIRDTGLTDAMAMLHRSPGEHAPTIRMNWFWMQAWRWLADTTAYLVLFISVSGVYLCYMLKAERKVGFILLFAGALSFFGLAYVLSR